MSEEGKPLFYEIRGKRVHWIDLMKMAGEGDKDAIEVYERRK